MHLIVGLGNPGGKYENTRHNLGFRVLDLLGGAVDWETKYQSLFLKLNDVVLAKPQTFMNLSGKAVKEISSFYPEAQLIVIHDELDLPLGSIKVQKNISDAGHNGVASLIEELGTKDFTRIRLGVNNPETKGQIPADDYVLQKFADSELALVNEMIEKAKAAVETIQTEGLEAAQSKFNG